MATASNEVNHKQIIFKDYITGMPKESDMFLKSTKLSFHLESESQDVIVKNLYLSCDPYMRGRMQVTSYLAAPFTPGLACESSITHGAPNSFQVPIMEPRPQFIPTVISSSVRYGVPGFTAYVGFYEVSSPKLGENVFISAAAGAVGQIAGQFAKMHGCYVVGSAGSEEKVELLKNKLGFDDAFNYKEEPDLKAALRRYFPSGIDIYFENVGGEMLEAVIENMNTHGRIAACGMISQYNLEEGRGVRNLIQLIIKSIKIEGFLLRDYWHMYPQFLEKVRDHMKAGKMVYFEDIVEGLENAPSAFVGVFHGKNMGKQLVRICDE